ncbi:hypothetical protein [Sphingomonas sp. Leaf62]|uniref:hypothetical protein n=1 Tax=Sphingomonas sp. Leaf62 TaxID=1736228 RepID=UPI0006FED305|nr:hypothetical protein [Sphingomonas sp. Leaf62]KQN71472.1 hypothetical protein ASE91_06225 [Sphingomonas sp. Leaf62]
MDEDDRAEIRAAYVDAKAIGSVAIAGVVSVCAVLLRKGHITPGELSEVNDFMVAAVERSEASPHMQANLHEAIGHQFSALVAALDRTGTIPPTQEG